MMFCVLNPDAYEFDPRFNFGPMAVVVEPGGYGRSGTRDRCSQPARARRADGYAGGDRCSKPVGVRADVPKVE